LGSRSSFKLIPLLLAAALCVADDRFLFERARALEQAADLPGAEAAYRAYLQQSPASAEALGNLGVVLARQSKYEGAAAAYRQATHPETFWTGLARGRAGIDQAGRNIGC